MRSLSDLLRETRRRRFVGRGQEITRFEVALAATERTSVLFVHGLAGTGKTWLLDEMAATSAAKAADVAVVRVDVRRSGPTPESVLSAIRDSAGTDLPHPGLRSKPERSSRTVLLVDSYDLVDDDADERLREELATLLPARTVVVIAGRRPPGPRWAADPAWRELLTTIRLGPLSPQDAVAYLAAEQVPEEMRHRFVELSGRQPLALSLLVDASRRNSRSTVEPASLAEFPGVVRELLERVVDTLPSPDHRAALEACAHMRSTTECRLRSALDAKEDVHLLFDWLRTLPFIEEGPSGLQPNPLVRAVVDADLRWRDVEGYAALHRRVRRDAVDRARRSSEAGETRRSIQDAIFAARWHHAVGGHRGPIQHELSHDELRPRDRSALLDMAFQHLGREQTELVAHWVQRRPETVRVFRDAAGDAVGFACVLDLHAVSADDLHRDEGARAMWLEATRSRPPRPGEEVLAWRFLVDRERRLDAESPVLPLAVAWRIERGLRRRCAWELVGFIDEVEAWGPLMKQLDFDDVGATYAAAGREYSVFGRDWRRASLDDWLERTSGGELGRRSPPRSEAVAEEVLSEAQFAEAVRCALRDFHVRERLAGNPLVRTKIVEEVTGEGSPVAAVQALLRSAAEVLRTEPRSEGLFRCVDKAYLRPARTHERAAAELGIPYNTYRRHRDRAVARIAGWMWHHELGGDAPPIRADLS
ncbi:AAA family ATPase [Pseudonocardia sp. TRM90224]|uniref:AAA family ATPase n=1 Tax=Pseudonocardia sp. TRM90224 TaxID=2812678 RepID=UPI001E3E4C25|nr:AAA family ATPase [Pseudonocardia sp. TRM90224]